MKKSVMTIATVTMVGLSGTFFTGGVTVHANKDISQIQQERTSIKANLSDTDAKIADVLIDLDKLNQKIDRVNSAIKANQKKMGETKGEIADAKENIANLKDEMAKLQKKIDERYKILQDRMSVYQKNGGDIGFLDVIFGSKNFGDFISRITAVKKITSSDADLMKKQKADKDELAKKEEKVHKKLDKLKDMKAEIGAVQETMEEQKKQNEADKKELKTKSEKLNTMKEKLSDKDSHLATLEAKVKQEIKAKKEEEAKAAKEAQAKKVQANEAQKASPAKVKAAESTKSTNSTKSTGHTSAPAVKTTTKAPKPSGSISAAISAGYKYIGNSVYVFGGGRTQSDIQHGRFDCSSFVSWALGQAGISAPATTTALSGTGTSISISDAQPGDLVFFDTYKHNGHVGIYMGNGKFIGSQSSTGVAVANMNSGYWKNHFHGVVRRVR